MKNKMGFRFISILLMAFLFRSQQSFANTSKDECAKVADDLRGMQEAQKQILSALSRQNQSLAETLDQHADVLNKKINRTGKIKKTDVETIHRSADSFRQYGEKEKSLVLRFQKASDQVLAKVQACLGSAGNNESIEKLGQR